MSDIRPVLQSIRGRYSLEDARKLVDVERAISGGGKLELKKSRKEVSHLAQQGERGIPLYLVAARVNALLVEKIACKRWLARAEGEAPDFAATVKVWEHRGINAILMKDEVMLSEACTWFQLQQVETAWAWFLSGWHAAYEKSDYSKAAECFLQSYAAGVEEARGEWLQALVLAVQGDEAVKNLVTEVRIANRLPESVQDEQILLAVQIGSNVHSKVRSFFSTIKFELEAGASLSVAIKSFSDPWASAPKTSPEIYRQFVGIIDEGDLNAFNQALEDHPA